MYHTMYYTSIFTYVKGTFLRKSVIFRFFGAELSSSAVKSIVLASIMRSFSSLMILSNWSRRNSLLRASGKSYLSSSYAFSCSSLESLAKLRTIFLTLILPTYSLCSLLRLFFAMVSCLEYPFNASHASHMYRLKLLL